MKRREWFARMFGGAATAAAAVLIPGTSVEASPAPVERFYDPEHPLYGYFVRGWTDYTNGSRLCPIMPDEGYEERVRAWYVGFCWAEQRKPMPPRDDATIETRDGA